MSRYRAADQARVPVRVSVLITSYQHERYIARALEGVLEQGSEVPLEILVGDDASTDGTRTVIARYAEERPDRVRTFFPERNLGLGGKAIFAELIGRARGDYLAMLDGDDFWTSPEKLRRQVAYLDEHPECSMCFHNVLCRFEDDARPDEPYNSQDQASEVDMDELLRWCPVASCSPVFRRHALDPLPAWYFELPWGDWPLYFLAAQHGQIHYLPDLMGVYRIHQDGMYSGLPRLQALEGLTAFYERLDGVVPPEHESCRRARLGENWLKRALEHDRSADYAAARRCLSESLRVRPLDPRRLRLDPREKQRLSLWLRLRAPSAVRLAARRRGGSVGDDDARAARGR